MDHFAKPDDELARAQQHGDLYRNFQGYSTHANCDLVALGATSIGMVGDTYSQNLRGVDEYSAAIGRGTVPVFRGIELSADDRLRRDVITQLICNLRVSAAAVESRHGIRFSDYFAPELEALGRMHDDGLLKVDADGVEVLPSGRLLIRNICMVFDAYLRESTGQRFSKVI
jgi:oxygen-independent coproporphyrinogen-3 oxidase